MLEFIKEMSYEVLDMLPYPVHIMSREMKIWRNQASKKLFPEKLSGPYCYQVLVGREDACSDCTVMEVFETGIKRAKTRKYEGRILEINILPLFDESGSVVAVEEAILDKTGEATKQTKLNKAVDELRELSLTDDLTGALNRRGIFREIDHELMKSKRTKKKFSLIMLDVDNLKPINDEYGHSAGNLILKGLVEIARDKIRSIDEIGRLGGDEFIILLPETPIAGTVKSAERIREGVASYKFIKGEATITTTISLGVAECDHNCNIVEIIELVDKLLYKSKGKGGNKVAVIESQN